MDVDAGEVDLVGGELPRLQQLLHLLVIRLVCGVYVVLVVKWRREFWVGVYGVFGFKGRDQRRSVGRPEGCVATTYDRPSSPLPTHPQHYIHTHISFHIFLSYLGDADLPRAGGVGVEVARRAAEDQVALGVALVFCRFCRFGVGVGVGWWV